MSSEPGKEPALSPEAFQAFLRAALPGFGLKMPATVFSNVGAYLSELDHWRRRINLTGNLSAGELVDHTLESLLASDVINHGARVVDVGAGAGFPGLLLAISRSDLRVTLVEPRAKKCAFLRHVARTLKLSNVAVFEGRIEEVGGQTFDVATTRALGDVAGWLAGGELLATGGALLAWTTTPEALAASLSATFEQAGSIPIPGAERRQIAVLRRR
jgi:16S rRNA (guanine527-N7)-methyltransferase